MNNVQTSRAVKPVKRKRGKSLDRKKAKMGWVFVAPFAIGFFLLYLPMILESIRFSFSDMVTQKGGGYILEFVGFKNYNYVLFEDADFVTLLGSSVSQLLLDVPAIVIFSLFIAILLNQKMVGRGLFRAIFFIPVIISTGLVEWIDLQNIFAANSDTSATIGTGAEETQTTSASDLISTIDVQRLFAGMKVGTELVTYVTQMVNNVYNIINRSGVQMLIFLAGLQSISPAIYESAYMEGASSWETFWKITFPMISPMILVNGIYTVIDSFTSQSNNVMKYISDAYSGQAGQEASTAM
ncbi:MAG TPA: sugar ABC transporter permease, partial [Bacillota bacterium]|nr:sugar ABC transporter permease [Bacillota bacterium]